MKEYTIIEEEEASELLSIPTVISVIEKCFKEKAKGNFSALPKMNIKGKNGDLRITPGESSGDFNAIGFRLYDVIRDDFSNQPQPTIVYDSKKGFLKGIVISQKLGAYRTAAINAVMQNYFTKGKVDSLGVVGTGYQARIHTEMYAYLLKPKKLLIYGRTESKLDQFILEMREKIHHEIEIIKCLDIADLSEVNSLLLVTRSNESLLDTSIFKRDMVITTIGPKIKGRSELSNEFAETCDLLVTDAKEQVNEYGERFFINDLSRVIDFADFHKNEALARRKYKKVLLCSVGMGGTEVALANELIEKKRLKLKED